MKKEFDVKHYISGYIYHIFQVDGIVVLSYADSEGKISSFKYSVEETQRYLDDGQWIDISEEVCEEISAQEAMKRLEEQSGKKVKIVR